VRVHIAWQAASLTPCPATLPSAAPSRSQSPYVADHTVTRTLGVAPPGTKLADVTVLGKPLRPDLASGVTAAGSDSDGGLPASVRHRFEDSSSAASGSGSATSSGASSGPDSAASSSSAGSASEGEGASSAAAAVSPRRAPSTLDGPAAAGDALGAAPSASSPRAFAVIALGGTQYKVTPGDVINAEFVKGAGDVGSALDVTAVHVVGTASRTVLGRPTVPGAVVRCTVEEVVRDAKVIVYKKNRRKRYQKTQGHRRLVTRLRVNAIDCDVGAF
jgi:ribosomal protein L21